MGYVSFKVRSVLLSLCMLFIALSLSLSITTVNAFAQTQPQCLPGKLCRSQEISPPSTSQPQTITHLTLNANQDLPGLDTGINVSAGGYLAIIASGKAAYGSGNIQSCSTTELTNPDGQLILANGTFCSNGKIDSTAVLPTSPVGTLLAQIGSSGWIDVGRSDRLGFATGGELFLLYNDVSGLYGNNRGSYQVTVIVRQQ